MERRAFRLPGFPMLLVAIAQPIATLAWLRYLDAQQEHLASTLVVIFGSLVLLALWTGFLVLSPNESRVVLFFGWYAGTVGWTDLSEDGEFCVAIRCALLRGSVAHLYAGNGIVRDSDPADELAETEVKLQALLPLLT